MPATLRACRSDLNDPSRPLPPFVTFKSTLYKAKLAVGLQPE
jgi:hypothetical protein